MPTAGSRGEPGRIYDDMILHMSNAIRRPPPSEKPGLTSSGAYRRSMRGLASVGGSLLPRSAKERLRARFGTSVFNLIDRQRVLVQDEEFERVRSEIIEDPEGFVDRLRARDFTDGGI
jgi:hypothetical protein